MSVPDWIEGISPYDIAAILGGGCASGAYMPAVTYHIASKVMAEHGDEVLDLLDQHYGETLAPPTGQSWKGMACYYLSAAVELWCSINQDLADWDDDEELS